MVIEMGLLIFRNHFIHFPAIGQAVTLEVVYLLETWTIQVLLPILVVFHPAENVAIYFSWITVVSFHFYPFHSMAVNKLDSPS